MGYWARWWIENWADPIQLLEAATVPSVQRKWYQVHPICPIVLLSCFSILFWFIYLQPSRWILNLKFRRGSDSETFGDLWSTCELGASVWPIPAQYGGLHPSQGAQSAEFEDDPSVRQTDVRITHVRSNSGAGPSNGAADPNAPRLQGIRMPCGGRVPQVVTVHYFFFMFYASFPCVQTVMDNVSPVHYFYGPHLWCR